MNENSNRTVFNDDLVIEYTRQFGERVLAEKHTIEVTCDELLKGKTHQIPFLLDGVFQRVGLACLAGSSDTGKSCLLRQLALAVATGQESFLGFKLNAVHQSAIYISTEDGREATSFLLGRQTQLYPSDKLKQARFIFDDENLFEEIENGLAAKPADVVIIDCFQDAYGADLKDTQKIRNWLHPFQLMAERHNCLFLFLHHTGKRTEYRDPSKNNLLSGQGLEAKMRMVGELRVDHTDPNLRHLCIVKGNYLSGKDKRESHALRFDESTLTFSSTGERVAFDMLVKKEIAPSEEKSTGKEEAMKAKYLLALELLRQQMSYTEIAQKLGYKGKSGVQKLFEKGNREGWDTAGFEPANEQEEEQAEFPF